MRTRAKSFLSAGALVLLLLASCSSPNSAEVSERAPSSAASPQATPPSASGTGSASAESDSPTPNRKSPALQEAQELVAHMSVREQAASLVMAGVPASGASEAEIAALQRQGLSNVFLRGRSQLSLEDTATQVQRITRSLERNMPKELPVWVATDQEGGYVRVLQGAGFTQLPTALEQGLWSEQKLEEKIGTVATELAAAGINVNLAPVADVVPEQIGTSNAPIGYFGREYSHASADVSKAITTVSQALASHAVTPVAKHFPGLGRVTENTDTNAGVIDTHIDANSSDLEPFAQAIAQGKSWVMVSNARYAKLDPEHDAVFSAKIIDGLLREQMGYTGIVISDDLCEAKQVQHVPVGDRAVQFIAAGGTIPLCVQSGPAVDMVEALTEEAASETDFALRIRHAATLVLEEKIRRE